MFFRWVLGRRNALAMGVWGTRRDPTQPVLLSADPPTIHRLSMGQPR
ncbi:hypothetical protein U2F10_10950 [Leptothoe sp. EHU-05/26/07-4]